MFPDRSPTNYVLCPAVSASPPLLQPVDAPGYPGTTPQYAHTPYSPLQSLMETAIQPAYPTYHLAEPRYGFRPQPPHAPPTPQPDMRDFELAYLPASWQA